MQWLFVISFIRDVGMSSKSQLPNPTDYKMVSQCCTYHDQSPIWICILRNVISPLVAANWIPFCPLRLGMVSVKDNGDPVSTTGTEVIRQPWHLSSPPTHISNYMMTYLNVLCLWSTPIHLSICLLWYVFLTVNQ